MHYDVRLRPDIYQEHPDNFTFSGDVTVHFAVETASNSIRLHYKTLNIDESQLVVKDSSDAQVREPLFF